MPINRCQDPEYCAEIRAEKRIFWKENRERIFEVYEEFLAYPDRVILSSGHGIERMQERGYTPEDAHEVIEAYSPHDFSNIVRKIPINLPNGVKLHEIPPNKRHLIKYKEVESYQFHIGGETADGRLLVVSCGFFPDPPDPPHKWIMRIITVLDPEKYPFQYQHTRAGMEKVCWCKTDEDDTVVK